MTTEVIIEVRGLTKRFGKVEAVNGIDFDVYTGELFGFLGPNGAGKTTTINMLTGLARPDTGSIRVAGIDCVKSPKAVQRLVGVVPDESNLYPELTGFENLCFCGALYGMSRRDRETKAKELLNKFGLNEAANRKFAEYSKGMKRRVTIAAGIIHSPPILFLDEPTTGIDVISARQIRSLIASLNASGTTIFLTTHYIEEAEHLCKRVAFIVKGRIVRMDTVEELMRQTDGLFVVQFAVDKGASGLCEALRSEFREIRCHAVSDSVLRIEDSNPVRISPLVNFIEKLGAEVLEARKIQPSLEDVFVGVTGIETAEMKQEKERAKSGGGV